MQENSTSNTASRQVASVSVLVGDRRVCEFMGSAGLGVTGAGVLEILRITYAPGEVVTEGRVMEAVQKMIEASDSEKTRFKLMAPKFLGVSEEACVNTAIAPSGEIVKIGKMKEKIDMLRNMHQGSLAALEKDP